MAKIKKIYKCIDCDFFSHTKVGLCRECGGVVEEEIIDDNPTSNKAKGTTRTITQISKKNKKSIEEDSTSEITIRFNTGYNGLDEVFGKNSDGDSGLTKGSFTLISGPPGIGKSTLLLTLLSNINEEYNNKCAYVSSEENFSQIKDRYERLNLNGDFNLLNESNLDVIMQEFEDEDVIIIDSISQIYLEGYGTIGGIAQVRECTIAIMQWCKEKGKTVIMIGHVTKDNSIAGPRVLEHMVDTVLYFEQYDSNSNYVAIRSESKNRYGAKNEIAVFEMCADGLFEIENPSLLFIDQDNQIPGTTLSMTLIGSKPIFVEVQALVSETKSDKPIISSLGYDIKRLYQIITIINEYLGIKMYQSNIFVSISGGIKIKESHLDLAVIMAILSSMEKKTVQEILNKDTVPLFLGEVGLNGKIIASKNEKRLVDFSNKFGFPDVISKVEGFVHIGQLKD
jgi:DNA repair protein RadA/Sms